MFKILGSLTKAAVSVATLPVNVAADVLTLGGAVNDKSEPYTSKNIKRIMKHLDDATE